MVMLNNLDLALQSISYKKNFSFRYSPASDSNHVNLTIVMLVPDVNDPTHEVPISSYTRFEDPLTNQLPVAQYIAQIRRYIRELEAHEFDEWFKVDGKCYNEPHPEMSYRE